MSLGRIIGAVIAAVATGGVLWILGVDAGFAVAWAALVLAVVIAATTRIDIADSAWPPPREEAVTSVSAVARLAWAINTSTGVARPHATRRVRALATAWLDERGLTLGDPADAPAIDALLGPQSAATLGGADARLDDLRRILARISSPTPETEGQS